jgi:hypothetical protein
MMKAVLVMGAVAAVTAYLGYSDAIAAFSSLARFVFTVSVIGILLVLVIGGITTRRHS